MKMLMKQVWHSGLDGKFTLWKGKENLKVTFPEDVFLQELMFRRLEGIGWDFTDLVKTHLLFLVESG